MKATDTSALMTSMSKDFSSAKLAFILARLFLSMTGFKLWKVAKVMKSSYYYNVHYAAFIRSNTTDNLLYDSGMWWMTLFPDSFSWTFPRLFHRTDRVGHVSWPCWASNFSEWRLPVLFAQKDQQWNDNLNSPVIHIRNPAFGKSEEQRLVRVEEFQGYSVQVFMSDCLLNGGWTEWHATDLILDCGKTPPL